MDLLTFVPFKTSVQLRMGLTPEAGEYEAVVAALSGLPENVHVFNASNGEAKEKYDDLSRDGYDLRLLSWTPPALDEDDADLTIHLFPNAVAIAEMRFHDELTLDADVLQKQVRARSRQLLDDHYGAFQAFVADVEQCIPQDCLSTAKELTLEAARPQIERVCRTLILSDEERRSGAYDRLIRDWLAETNDASDAEAIISGRSHSAMTWVNYVLVERPGEAASRDAELDISAMRIAQYLWSAQTWFSALVQSIIADTINGHHVAASRNKLSKCRARMHMLEIEHNTLRTVLTRKREARLNMILDGWGYERLVENGHLMGQLASQKIEEIDEKRQSWRSAATDLILGVIGFFIIVEVLLYVHEFGREVMSRPALRYNDSHSAILTFVGGLTTDTTILIALVAIVFLSIFYWWLRRNMKS